MTTSIDVSLVRERNERMLREVNANRLEKRLREPRAPVRMVADHRNLLDANVRAPFCGVRAGRREGSEASGRKGRSDDKEGGVLDAEMTRARGKRTTAETTEMNENDRRRE